MKKLLTVLFAAAMMLTMSITAFANDGTTTMYTTKRTVMYAEPAYTSAPVQTIEAAADIICYKTQANGFQNCFYGESAGWIALADLSTVRNGNNGGGTQNNLNGTYGVTMYTSQSVNLRKGPSTQTTVIFAIPASSPIYVYNVNDGWAEVDYGNTHGFVSTSYIQNWNTPQDYPVDATTWYNGYDWKNVYNFKDYMTYNPDVAKAYGNNPTAVIAHFVTYGMKEGRQASAAWNLQTYKNAHPELVALYGNNNEAYYKVACGIPQ